MAPVIRSQTMSLSSIALSAEARGAVVSFVGGVYSSGVAFLDSDAVMEASSCY